MDLNELSISEAVSAVLNGMATIGRAAVMRLLTMSFGVIAALHSPVPHEFEEEFEQLQGTGEEGIIEIQQSFMEFEGTVSEDQAEL